MKQIKNVIICAGLLSVAGHDGTITCFTLIDDAGSKAPVQSTQKVWAEADSIAVTHLTSWPWREGLLLVAAKGAFVIIFYLTSGGSTVTHVGYRSCDVTVTGILSMSTIKPILRVTKC